MLLDRSYSTKRIAFVSLLFVETCLEEQQDGHDLVLCELHSINLLVLVGGRALLCHALPHAGKGFLPPNCFTENTNAQAVCLVKSRRWKTSEPGSGDLPCLHISGHQNCMLPLP